MKTNYIFKARWLQGAASANESKKMQVNPRITPLRFVCALLVLLTFGVGNAWGLESSEVASSKSTSVTDGDLYIIATAKASGKYLTSTVSSNWGICTTTLGDAAVFTAHGNTSGFYLTCPAGTLQAGTGDFLAYNTGTTANLQLDALGNIVNKSSTDKMVQYNGSGGARWYANTQTALYLFKVTLSPKTLTFNAGSGSCKSSETEASGGSGIVLPSATPSSLCADDGWVFAGWKKTSAQTATTSIPDLIPAGSRYYPATDETLYAVYRKGEYEAIDFESATSAYTDWTFTTITSQKLSITAYSGSYYGNTNGSASGNIASKITFASPKVLRYYVSKESDNTTSSTWYVETSSDGSTWTERGTKSATEMSKGVWQKVDVDLSSYSNVYVRIRYAGSTAIRAIDNVIVSGATFNSNPDCTYDYFVDIMHDTEIDPVQGTYAMPSPSDKDPGDEHCDDKHYHFLGWVVEDEINNDGTLKSGYTLYPAGDAGHTADNKTFYAIWAKIE